MKWLRGIRLWGPVALLGAIWLTTSVATTFYIHWLDDRHHRSVAENVTSISAAADIQATLGRLFADLEHAEAKTTSDRQSAEPDDWSSNLKRLQTAADRAENSAFTPGERALVGVLREQIGELVVLRGPPAMASGDEKHESNDSRRRVILSLIDTADQYRLLNENLLELSAVFGRDATRVVGLVRLAIVVLGPLIGIFVGYRSAERLLSRLTEIRLSLENASTVGGVDQGPRGASATFDVDDLDKTALAIAQRAQRFLLELQTARQEAIRNERLAAIGQLATGVAHELRNPLTAVKLLVQTTAGKAERHGWNAESLCVVQSEIGRIEQVIQSLLDFSRPPPPRRSLHDLRDTLRRALQLTLGRAAQSHVKIDSHIPEEACEITADAEQLHQILVNLLFNGIDALPDGGTLEIKLERDMARNGYLVEVRDDGKGIAEELLSQIFEPFVTSKRSGTGLGLAISRRLAEEHGGQLTATNDPRGGAAFTLRLPTLG
jgi:two-component system sensor histidine kinase HydH